MKFLSIEPFVPSGDNFEGSKQLFLELGFKINWETDDLIGFEKDGCKFTLQKYDKSEFAENFMLSVRVNNIEEFWNEVTEKKLGEKFGVRIGEPTEEPYGKEVTLIDIAGVCWHFIE
jgi:hypothetical protein